MKTNYHPKVKGPRRAVTAIKGSIAAREGGAPLLVLAVAATLGVVLASALFLGYAAHEAGAQTAASTKLGVVAWGYNESGEANVPAGARAKIKAIAAGDHHSLALKEDGSVVAWGNNWYGQTSVPSGLTGVKAVAGGENHSLALKEDGSVLAWGRNADGQTSVPSGLTGVKAVAAGDRHSLALKEDGSVVAWGYNSQGQTDVPAGATSDVKAISAGMFHSLALREGGSVVAWGYNSQGQTDVPAAASSGVKAIAAGNHHNLALKEDGSVVAWGYSFHGQTNIPAGAQSGVKAISARDDHSLALKEDGSVVAWGKNFYGQASVPEGAQGGVEAIAAGGSHNLVLKEDTTPPDTSITSGPSGTTSSVSATLQFSSTEVGSTFECSLDGGSFVACDPGNPYENLDDGPHVFEVRATDAAGNVDPTPARREWTVDTGPPETNLTSGPSGSVNNTSAAFAYSSTERGSTFECRLDDASFASCDPETTLRDLGDGYHIFEARAVDAAGNADPTPVRRTWSVDTAAPNTGITDGPSGAVRSASATFEFLASEPGATFECSLNGADFATCDSPEDLTGLSDGSHEFRVRATDTAGNADPTPAGRTWTIDASAPGSPGITSPDNGSQDNDGSFVVRGTAERGATVRLFEGATRVGTDEAENGAWRIVLADVPDGEHTYAATATDAAGNTSAASAGVTVVVDSAVPGAPLITGPASDGHDTDGSFVVRGTAEEGARVSLFDWSTVEGTTTADDATGEWSIALTDVAEGRHRYTARATDAAANYSARSAPRAIIVDRTAPSVVEGSPSDGTKGVAPGANVVITFSEAMDRASVNGATVKLLGGGNAVPAEVTLAAGARRAILDPDVDLAAGAVYRVVVGARAKDVAGNPLLAAKVWRFSVKP